jgi:dTDP-4-amino-4,6-dideoxygalactose transaminase
MTIVRGGPTTPTTKEEDVLAPDSPAFLGGLPLFAERVPLVRPRADDEAGILSRISESLRSGSFTNGSLVRELEHRAQDYTGTRHCVAVSSCTVGLMLVLRACQSHGEVIMPSFTFSATAHAAMWNDMQPVFADVDPSTLTLSVGSVARALHTRTAAILATHLYGTPADVDELEALAASHGVKLIFDAAHAFGSRHRDRPIGSFGDAEVFSLSPTKVLVGGEGGIIATNDDLLAERCRMGRDYGHPGDYDCRFVGLNGRMSEFHAAIALDSLDGLDDRVAERNDLAGEYRRILRGVAGVGFPSIRPGDRSTFKDLTIRVQAGAFGMDADDLGRALKAEGVETKRYYSPPVHRMSAYRGTAGHQRLPHTDTASREVLTLPLWSEMGVGVIAGIGDAIARIGASIGASQTRA